MTDNAAVLRQLHRRIHETLGKRHLGPVQLKAWSNACGEFHDRYGALAMPGGYGAVLEGLERSDPGTIDIALCFVELRPYFFRSGYMYTRLTRRLKKCAKTPEQADRHAPAHVPRQETISDVFRAESRATPRLCVTRAPRIAWHDRARVVRSD